MGYFRHHAIIVTGTNLKAMRRAHRKARKLFKNRVSDITPSRMNGFLSFLIPPDGSKEYWPESDHYDRRREKMQRWLHKRAHADGSNPYDWIEIEYGGDGVLVKPDELLGGDIPF